MHYCQNCGAKIESNQKVCSLCGYNLGEKESDSDKNAGISELELDVLQLRKQMLKQLKKARISAFSPWIVIMPIAFFVIFFGFVILIVLIARG